MAEKKTTNQLDEKTEAAAEEIREQLEESLEEIDTPQKAEALINRLVDEAGDRRALEAAEDVPQAEGAPPPAQAETAAAVIDEAADSAASEIDRAAGVIEAAAAEAAGLEGPAYEALAESVQDVTNPALHGQPEKLKERRRWLFEALKRHPGVGLLQTYDTELFVLINNYTPRTPAIDSFFYRLSYTFKGGMAWLVGVALSWPFCRGWTLNVLKQIASPIWVTGIIVEGPVKSYFRRRRPFIDIVRAVVVGKKPGNWSFPSGHSAVAFAGAKMLSRFAPRLRWLWYIIAGLVGFSRIYLGAHYPGDVLSGSLCGLGLAELTHRIMKRIIK